MSSQLNQVSQESKTFHFEYPKAKPASTALGRVWQIISSIVHLPIDAVEKISGLVKGLIFPFFIKDLMSAAAIDTDYTGRAKHLETQYQGESIELVTKHKTTVRGMFFDAKKSNVDKELLQTSFNENPSENGPTVLLCQGNDSSIFDYKYEDLIKSYLARNINVMIVDYQGVGMSRGAAFSEQGSYDTAEVAMEFLLSKEIPKEKILVEGYSMGSGPATDLTAKYPGTNLLLRCPFVKPSEVGDAILEKNHVSLPVRFVATKICDYLLHYDNCSKIHNVAGSVGIISDPNDANLHEYTKHHADRLVEAITKDGMYAKSLQHRQINEGHFSKYVTETALANALDEYLIRIGFTTPSFNESTSSP